MPIGYIGGCRADENQPLGIGARTWPLLGASLVCVAAAWVAHCATRRNRASLTQAATHADGSVSFSSGVQDLPNTCLALTTI